MGLTYDDNIALIDDLHFGMNNFNLDFLEEQLNSLQEYCKTLKDKNVIEEIENTWNVRCYKFKKGKKELKENSNAIEKVLEFFNVKSDNISVYKENLLQEIKSMSMDDDKANSIIGSDIYIKEYIKDNKPSLLPLLEKIWK